MTRQEKMRAKRGMSGSVRNYNQHLRQAAAAAIEPLEQRVMLSATPSWLATNGVATWDSSTHILTVTGSATITADPGSDAPLVTVSGPGATLIIQPAG
jgi:hypothetical protein